MAYQKLQPERAYTIPSGDNFDILLDNPLSNIKQKLKSANGDVSITYNGSGVLTEIRVLKDIYVNQLTKLPTATIAITGGGSISGLATSSSANGLLTFTFTNGGSGWVPGSSIVITLSEYKIIPSSRLQPFVVYTSSCTSIGSAYSAGGDSMGTVTCAANTMLPFQFSSLTPSSNSVIALW